MKFIKLTKIFESLKPEMEFKLENFRKTEREKPERDDDGRSAEWYLDKGMQIPDWIFNPEKSITFKEEDYETLESEIYINVDSIKDFEDYVKHDEFEYSILDYKDGDYIKVKEESSQIINLINN